MKAQANNPVEESAPVIARADQERHPHRSDGKRLLQVANTLLLLSMVVALICLVVLYRKNTKLRQEQSKRISSNQKTTGTMAGPPGIQVGDVLPSFETRSAEGVRSSILYDGKSKYLFFIFSPQCGACSHEFPTWSQIAPHAAAQHYRAIGLELYDAAAEKRPGVRELNFEALRFPSPAIQRAYRVTSVPMVMLVSGEGKVEWVSYGELPAEKIKELLSRIDGVVVEGV